MPQEIQGNGSILPLDFTRLSSQAIGQIHSEWAGRLAYAISLAGKIESEIAGRKAAMVRTDDTAELKAEIADLQVDQKQIASAVKASETLMRAASREITRRSSERVSSHEA